MLRIKGLAWCAVSEIAHSVRVHLPVGMREQSQCSSCSLMPMKGGEGMVTGFQVLLYGLYNVLAGVIGSLIASRIEQYLLNRLGKKSPFPEED